MPGAQTHRHLTAAALRLAGIDAPELVAKYCTYPDDYLDDPETVAPYLHTLDGIPLHYLPDSSVDEAYRYWRVDDTGRIVQSRSCRNENYRHARTGFVHTFSSVRAALQQDRRADAEKFLGVLLHVLEDSAFALHAFEGAGGADIYALDRMSGVEVLRALAGTDSTGLLAPEYTPQILGPTPELAAMRLYALYARRCRDSRHAMFQLALPVIAQQVQVDEKALRQRMFDNAVKLCADAAYTAFNMERAPKLAELPLEELEPVHSPLGGAEPWRLRGAGFAPGKIAFGVNYEAHLHFDVAPGYAELTGVLRRSGFEKNAPLHVAFLNDGKPALAAVLDENTPELSIRIAMPHGLCGADVTASQPSGTLELLGFRLIP